MARRGRSLASLLIATIVIAVLSACGQRGPLILPDDAAETSPSGADQNQSSNDEQEENAN